MKFLIVTVHLIIIFSTTFSQAVKQKYRIEDLQFMAGQWKTSADWGDMEEFWSGPNGNCMMCSFRCVKDGKVVFYEFVVIEQNETDEAPVMKLRHFNPGSIGWEEKENPYLYPLISLQGEKAVFERPDKKTTLSYERISKSTLKSVLTQETEGKWKTTEFVFTQ
jgi:hypothetical protein